MSNSAVRSAFATLFADSQIQALTTKSYNYDILDDSETDIAKYKYNQEINFFIYLVSQGFEYKAFGEVLETYSVEIKYYKEDNKSGTNQNAIRDNLATLITRLRTVLGVTWSGTVDYYTIQDAPISLENINLAGDESWLGRVVLIGYKSIC